MADNTLPLFADAGKFYVYVYRDPRPRKKGAPIYVGKGTRRRADIHWREGAKNPILQAILTKIRLAGLQPIVELIAWYDDEASAFACEIALISQFGRRDLGNGPLCNLSDGGEGPSGMKQSPEHIARLAKLSSERVRSEDERERIRSKLRGHTVSQDTRRKISEANRGRSLSADQRAKLSEAQKLFMADPANREAARLSSTGRRRSPETCAKIGNVHRGKTVSAEAREKLRQANLGKTTSYETRLKQSEALKRYWTGRRANTQ